MRSSAQPNDDAFVDEADQMSQPDVADGPPAASDAGLHRRPGGSVGNVVAIDIDERSPHSKYRVGAAIATKRGSIFVGCNVENATFGATICAERGAIMQMVAQGETDPIACAVVTEDGGSPCGICRQVLSEFARDMPIVLSALNAKSREGESGEVVMLADLLPRAFRLRQ
jgi:cytidine deaminase